MDLNAVSIFVKVVQAGSFSKAARDLRAPKSTVSKRVAELEAHLKLTLLRRTTRSLQLTDQGRQFYEQAARSISELKAAETTAQAASAEPAGLLRVTAVSDFANELMAPLFGGFLRAYPKIELELVLTDKVLDLVNDNIDVAVRIGKVSDSSLQMLKLGRHWYRLFASPAYLKDCPPLKNPEDLKRHPCLFFTHDGFSLTWNLRAGAYRASVQAKGQFRANNPTAVKALAVAGAGVALLPVPVCLNEIESKKLINVLPSWGLEDAPVHFLYQKHLFTPPKVKAFLDYMTPRLRELLA